MRLGPKVSPQTHHARIQPQGLTAHPAAGPLIRWTTASQRLPNHKGPAGRWGLSHRPEDPPVGLERAYAPPPALTSGATTNESRTKLSQDTSCMTIASTFSIFLVSSGWGGGPSSMRLATGEWTIRSGGATNSFAPSLIYISLPYAAFLSRGMKKTIQTSCFKNVLFSSNNDFLFDLKARDLTESKRPWGNIET